MTLFQIVRNHNKNDYLFSIGSITQYGSYVHEIGVYKDLWTDREYINVLKEL